MRKTAKGLVKYAKAQLGNPYWYGTFGQKGYSLLNRSDSCQSGSTKVLVQRRMQDNLFFFVPPKKKQKDVQLYSLFQTFSAMQQYEKVEEK